MRKDVRRRADKGVGVGEEAQASEAVSPPGHELPAITQAVWYVGTALVWPLWILLLGLVTYAVTLVGQFPFDSERSNDLYFTVAWPIVALLVGFLASRWLRLRLKSELPLWIAAFVASVVENGAIALVTRGFPLFTGENWGLGVLLPVASVLGFAVAARKSRV